MPRILFVCTANQIRSPLAEHLFRQLLAESGTGSDDWEVASGGTWARAGAPAMPKMAQVAAEMSLDLSAHRARAVDAAMLQSSDLVLCMAHGHVEALRAEYPALADRIHLLGAFSGIAHDVSDPVGRSLGSHRSCAKHIERLLRQGLPAIAEAVT